MKINNKKSSVVKKHMPLQLLIELMSEIKFHIRSLQTENYNVN